MAYNFKIHDFVVCDVSSGHIMEGENPSQFTTHFCPRSVGVLRIIDTAQSVVYVIGEKADYLLPNSSLIPIDPTKTGKGFDKKICNICHVLKEHSEFDANQTDARGRTTTRPSCRICRRDIDQRPMTPAAIQEANRHRPPEGTLWQCPICRKQSIVGVTAKVVLDHRHSDGSSRTFICDSCNTGLGRFKNGENYLRNAIAYLEQFER